MRRVLLFLILWVVLLASNAFARTFKEVRELVQTNAKCRNYVTCQYNGGADAPATGAMWRYSMDCSMCSGESFRAKAPWLLNLGYEVFDIEVQGRLTTILLKYTK